MKVKLHKMKVKLYKTKKGIQNVLNQTLKIQTFKMIRIKKKQPKISCVFFLLKMADQVELILLDQVGMDYDGYSRESSHSEKHLIHAVDLVMAVCETSRQNAGLKIRRMLD